MDSSASSASIKSPGLPPDGQTAPPARIDVHPWSDFDRSIARGPTNLLEFRLDNTWCPPCAWMPPKVQAFRSRRPKTQASLSSRDSFPTQDNTRWRPGSRARAGFPGARVSTRMRPCARSRSRSCLLTQVQEFDENAGSGQRAADGRGQGGVCMGVRCGGDPGSRARGEVTGIRMTVAARRLERPPQ